MIRQWYAMISGLLLTIVAAVLVFALHATASAGEPSVGV